MKKTAIIYSFGSTKTAKIAEKIVAEYNDNTIVKINAETVNEKQLLEFDNLILGVPTWFDGELPNYWDELIPAIEDLKMKNQKVALFGLGDQKNYPENFLDAVGILASVFENIGATIVGFTSTKGYNFEKSKAVEKDYFKGLAIDFENQPTLNASRIADWVKKIKTEFL